MNYFIYFCPKFKYNNSLVNLYIMANKVSRSEQQWIAESDADTLARYQEIVGNPNRLKRAISAADKREKELRTRADALRGVTKIRSSKRK